MVTTISDNLDLKSSVHSLPERTEAVPRSVPIENVLILLSSQENQDKNEQKRLQEFLKLINKVKQIRIKYQVIIWSTPDCI